MNRAAVVQKVATPSQVQRWLHFGDDFLAGFVLDAAGAAPANTVAKIYEAMGLGYPGSPFSSADSHVDVLRFRLTPVMTLANAIGKTPDHPRGFIEPPPFTGTGAVQISPDRRVVPLWWLDPTRVPAGAELWRVHANGSQELLATYRDASSGWESARDAASDRPQPLGGNAPPSDLVGAFIAPSTESERSQPEFGVRVTARWRGAEFQAVRRISTETGEVAARIVYIGRDATEAENIGLEKIDAGVYEATVPWHELENVEAVHFPAKQVTTPSGIPVETHPTCGTVIAKRIGVAGAQLSAGPRVPGLWLKTVDGWFPSSASVTTRTKFLNLDTFYLTNHDGSEFQCSSDEILGAHFITQWCTLRGLRWRVMALYDDEGGRDNSGAHLFITHDSAQPKSFAEYQEIAASIPNCKAIHPRAYNGSRLEATVALGDVSDFEQVTEWSYGDQT